MIENFSSPPPLSPHRKHKNYKAEKVSNYIPISPSFFLFEHGKEKKLQLVVTRLVQASFKIALRTGFC
jgi:hypothetical protein